MGIFLSNPQASKVLKLERNSLEFLLHHFCGVTANKEYVFLVNFPIPFICCRLWFEFFFFFFFHKLWGWPVNSLQIPECRLEITSSSWGDAQVQLKVVVVTCVSRLQFFSLLPLCFPFFFLVILILFILFSLKNRFNNSLTKRWTSTSGGFSSSLLYAFSWILSLFGPTNHHLAYEITSIGLSREIYKQRVTLRGVHQFINVPPEN